MQMTEPAKRRTRTNQGRSYIPVTVPFAATPAGEPPDIRQWAHRGVWSERMLTTLLEDRVKGGKWHTLIDKVFSDLNLYTSAYRVLGNKGAPGVDGQTTKDFAEHERAELHRLQEQLKQGTYRPASVKRAWIDKPGSQEKRPLGIPTIPSPVAGPGLPLRPPSHRPSDGGSPLRPGCLLCRHPRSATRA